MKRIARSAVGSVFAIFVVFPAGLPAANGADSPFPLQSLDDGRTIAEMRDSLGRSNPTVSRTSAVTSSHRRSASTWPLDGIDF